MSDERELRQLYQAMREQDAHGAPSFARVANLARPTAANLGYLRAVAITVALVLVVAMFAVNALRRRELPPQVAQTPMHVAAPVVVQAPVVAATPQQQAPRAVRHRKHAPPSIDDWKSPTDAWLETPDESFRNSVPSLSYSSVNLSD
jgi:hypothetical protein